MVSFLARLRDLVRTRLGKSVGGGETNASTAEKDLTTQGSTLAKNPSIRSSQSGIRRHGFGIVFIVALIGNLLPLTAKYLPFTDLSGHMGLVGAMAHAHEPAARTSDYFVINVRWIPSHLYDGFVYFFGRLMGVPAASNLFLAVFVVAALPLSVLYALRVFGRDQRLALLVFPLIYNRCLWFGFVNFVSGVPMVLAGIALLSSLLETPRDKPLVLAARAFALSVLAQLVVAAHFFAASAFFGFAVLLLLLRPIRLHRHPVALVALYPGARFLKHWLDSKLSTPNASASTALREQLRNAQSFTKSLELFYDWSIDGLANRVDDHLIRVTFFSVVAAIGWALWFPSQPTSRTRWRLRAPLMLAATVIVFFALPMALDTPPWWAVNVRVVVLIWALVVLCIPRTRKPMPAWFLAPVAVASIAYGGYLTWDFHRWYNGVEMAGFDRVLDRIPPGARVQALWPDFESEKHYSHFPMAHAGTYYTVRRGGLAVPMMDGAPDDLWVTPRPIPPQPGWGLRNAFSWDAHGAYWDYFIVKDPQPGAPPAMPIFSDVPEGAVRLVVRDGLWRVFERVRTSTPTP
jgi:hypothetical protein